MNRFTTCALHSIWESKSRLSCSNYSNPVLSHRKKCTANSMTSPAESMCYFRLDLLHTWIDLIYSVSSPEQSTNNKPVPTPVIGPVPSVAT